MSSPAPDAAPPGPAVHYAYMFERNKGPTKQLDALLRAIARHIMVELGDKADAHLTPAKLAAFYKAVGGDYDSLFVDMPHSSISFIWQVTGCQHTLQPTHDDFEPPSVPALTLRGFSRWESLEILLGPEEHVPFMQYAVRNWALRHPETGEDFPPDLPADVFPAESDSEVDRWHKACADRLRSDAASSAEDAPPPKPYSPAGPQPEPRFGYVRTNPFQPASPRPQSDFFGRPVYVHIPARHAGRRRPEPSPRQRDAADERMRRKSFSDYASVPPGAPPPPPYHDYASAYLDPGARRSAQPRRRSHPRRSSSDSSGSNAVPEPVDREAQRRRHAASPPPPPPSVRRVVPPTAPVPPPPPTAQPTPPAFRAHRSDMRPDEAKRRNIPSPLGSLRNKLSETMSSMLPNGLTSDRPRAGSRRNSSHDAVHVRRPREPLQPSRLSHGFSDLDSESSSDSMPAEALRRRRRMQEERERDRHRRGRPHDANRADWDDDRDSGGRRERPHLRRPETHRRTSSHADVDRQREQAAWDARGVGDRAREERGRRGRRSPEEATGMGGRRYPESAYS